MKYVDEFRNADAVRSLANDIHQVVTRPWSLMEVCGGQTHAIMRHGLHQLLPKEITLLHGPGCPVCVTPQPYIDKAIEIASHPGVIFTTFGDMLRVPSAKGDLALAKARGADVRIVYSPLEAVDIACQHPDKDVVFFAVGFETTAPANALAAYQAKVSGLQNFSMLVSQTLVPAALEALVSQKDCRIDAFLAAGHVCAVMGLRDYEPIAAKYGKPIVATGFEPADILRGVLAAVRQLEAGTAQVENCYERVVAHDGNAKAQSLLRQVFEVTEKEWRGIGTLPHSGLKLRPSTYGQFDAERRFGLVTDEASEERECMSGPILQGVKKPIDCPHFGKSCTPDTPIGVTMVSAEGACSAYYLNMQFGA